MKNKSQNIGLMFFALMGMVPFGLAFIYALLYSFGIVGAANDGFTLEFWTAVWESGEFVHSFAYSAAISLVSILISVALALWFTLLFHRAFQGRFLSFVMYLPLCIPGVVAAFFTVQLLSKAGFFSRIMYRLGIGQGISSFPDLINDTYGIGIILTFISVVMPFFLLLFLSVYKNERVEELNVLASALGASDRQRTYRISLPVILHKTWTIIALYFIFLLGAYEVPLILGQESPQMLSVLIVRELHQYDLTRLSEGYVVAVVYTIIVSLLAILLFSRRNKMQING